MKLFKVAGSYLIVPVVIMCALTALILWKHFTPDLPLISIESAQKCESNFEKGEQKIHCWYGLIEKTLDTKGIKQAFTVFTMIYQKHPVFAQSGCHVHAHKLGDMAYYRLYVAGSQNLADIDFPQETTSCGYGFFHGFLEHLIEDHPKGDFITKTCDSLHARLGNTMGDIRRICYHGSGHGLMLAKFDTIPKKQWGNINTFADAPLTQCESLPEANDREKQECSEGVFNVIVNWMEEKKYGFSYDLAWPFSPCTRFETLRKKACYYEMAQKLESITGKDVLKLDKFLAKEPDQGLRDMAFAVAVAGMIQSMADTEQHIAFVITCTKLNEHDVELCIRSVVGGLFEHGEPQNEYAKAIDLCRMSAVSVSSANDACWNAVAGRLSRFYNEDTKKRICRIFPEDRRQVCMAAVSKSDQNSNKERI